MKRYLLFLAMLLVGQLSAQNINQYDYPTIDSLMMLAYQKSDFETAIRYMEIGRQKAKVDFGRLDSVYAEYTSNLGVFYDLSGEYLQAEELFIEVLEIDKANGDNETADYGTLLTNLSMLYRKMGKPTIAEPYLLEGMEVFKKVYGDQHPAYAQSLNSMALLYVNKGQMVAAESLYLEALEIIRNSLGKEAGLYATFSNNLGGLYRQLGNYTASERLFQEALAINEKLGGKQSSSYAQSLNNLAVLYVDMRKFKTAEKHLLETLAINKLILGSAHPDYAQSLNNLAALYVRMGKYEEAEKLAIQVVEIDRNALGENHPNYALTLNNLADLYSRSGNYELARSQINQAIQALCKDCDSLDTLSLETIHQHDFYSLKRLIESLETIQKNANLKYQKSLELVDLKEGYKALQAAMKVNEKMRNGFNGDKDKLRALRVMSNLVHRAIATGIILNEAQEESYIEAAFGYAEQNKSVLLADAVKGSKARIMGDLPTNLAEQEVALQQEKKELEKAEQEARSQQEKAKIKNKRNSLNLKIDAFLKELKHNYPKYHHLKYESITTNVKEVQSLLDDQTLLLEYFVADTILYLFVVGKESLELFPISMTKKDLKKEIRDLRKALSNYNFISKKEKEAYQMFTHRASMFYLQLLEKALKNKSIENLIIVTDGELGHLPFETFLVEVAPQELTNYKDLHYLIKDYNISYDYSATLFVEAKRQDVPAKQRSNTGKILACAATYEKHSLEALVELRSFHQAQLRLDLDALPAAQEEIQGLSELFAGQFLIGSEANEANFKAQASQYSIIHLAMHGILDERLPILSSMAFTENKDSLEDNFLQAYEIAHLHLNADLVVLSACETGFGKFEQGEGVISLARSFMYAGTPSLVVSLWQVNDKSTAIIMQAFYEHLAAHKTKDEALRLAKLTYLEHANGIAAHPAFWSAFIQLGDRRAIVLQHKRNWLPWLLGGLLLLIGGGILVCKLR